jgi:hypothetical protein
MSTFYRETVSNTNLEEPEVVELAAVEDGEVVEDCALIEKLPLVP